MIKRIAVICATAAVAALLGSPSAASVPAAAPAPAPVHRLSIPEALDLPATVASAPVAPCPAASRTPVPDGQPIVVSMAPARPFTVGAIPATMWRNPPVRDPTWQMRFQGLMWMPPLAKRARADGSTRSLAALVAQAVAFHTQNPDPGKSVYGWDEGTAMRRLEVLNCLYSLTRSRSLRGPMAANAKVQLGPRYYGPPYRRVHNHGVMANTALIVAAQLIGVPAWKATAVRRLGAEAPFAFSRRGMTWEQSSMYQGLNVVLWGRAASVIAAATSRTHPSALTIQRILKVARPVYRWFAEPDGNLVQIGDSDNVAGWRPLSTARVFRDDQTGYVVGRWSPTDRATTYYTLRYGPPRAMHGHDDRPGVTWSTSGARVLVGPGRYTYDPATSWVAYQRGPIGHNVAIASGPLLPRPVALVSQTVQTRAHAWQLRDTLYGRTHVRGVNVNHRNRSLYVVDSYSGSGRFLQVWHLDPAWVLTRSSATRLTFRHPSGRVLTVATTGRVSSVVRGRTRPVGGWQFPKFGVRHAAAQITMRSVGTKIATTFVVR